ncbi:MAG: arsenite methyltransferase [Desulfobulbaceae bacterium]|nr:arsenite methyltransferase [Desulfobulbaceae bacterium]
MSVLENDGVRQAVREVYSRVAEAGCCGSTCCSGPAPDRSSQMGYSAEEMATIPDGANLGLGCGNPQAIAALQTGEIVLDLGSGAGFDCFLAARQVGEYGHVIGVDMTPTMLSKARANAEHNGYRNVEFRLGEIENLPVANDCVDVILSNCVINLSPDKPRVFAEAFRVLKPGGRLAISDIVATAELPDSIRRDMALHAGCVAGASLLSELENMLRAAGFVRIQISPKEESKALLRTWTSAASVTDFIVSATIEAVKPAS